MASQTTIRLLVDGPVLMAIQTLFESAKDLYARGSEVLTMGIVGRLWNSEEPEQSVAEYAIKPGCRAIFKGSDIEVALVKPGDGDNEDEVDIRVS